jgi:hypothetical protein
MRLSPWPEALGCGAVVGYSDRRIRTQIADGSSLSHHHRPLNFVTSVAIFGSRIRFLP